MNYEFYKLNFFCHFEQSEKSRRVPAQDPFAALRMTLNTKHYTLNPKH